MLMVLRYNQTESGYDDPVPLIGWREKVWFDAEKEEWWTLDNPTRRFRFGQDVRVPEHPENVHYFGPAFVYDDSNRDQQALAEDLVTKAARGEMPKP